MIWVHIFLWIWFVCFVFWIRFLFCSVFFCFVDFVGGFFFGWTFFGENPSSTFIKCKSVVVKQNKPKQKIKQNKLRIKSQKAKTKNNLSPPFSTPSLSTHTYLYIEYKSISF